MDTNNTADEINAPTKAAARVDQTLFDLVSNINILDAIAPLNYREQRSAFFSSHYSEEPKFRYRQNNIDQFSLKRGLFNLPVESIEDEDLAQLYICIINSYIDKIDQYKSVGNTEFLYDSLRYYGEPSEKDMRNAQFILHLPEESYDKSEKLLNAHDIKMLLHGFAEREGYRCDIKVDEAMIANALVSGTTVKINGAAEISETEAMALAHHELGVHLVTTINARAQPLNILSMGCPVNTMTQEGLAILSEYLAGCMTLKRLKILALRVIAVQSMITEKSFRRTFQLMKEQYGVSDMQAFTITARVYRGGGFTKDYLYLQGFHQILNAYENETDFRYLLAGKTAIDQIALISRLIDKRILCAPQLISPAFKAPVGNDSIRTFIAHAIK